MNEFNARSTSRPIEFWCLLWSMISGQALFAIASLLFWLMHDHGLLAILAFGYTLDLLHRGRLMLKANQEVQQEEGPRVNIPFEWVVDRSPYRRMLVHLTLYSLARAFLMAALVCLLYQSVLWAINGHWPSGTMLHVIGLFNIEWVQDPHTWLGLWRVCDALPANVGMALMGVSCVVAGFLMATPELVNLYETSLEADDTTASEHSSADE